MRWLDVLLQKLDFVTKHRATDTSNSSPEAPFELYLSELAELDERRRASLPVWQQDILIFEEFTRTLVEDGLLTSMSNHWNERDRLTDALTRIGEANLARLVADTAELAIGRQEANGKGLIAELAMNDEVVLEAFANAEKTIEVRWEEMWANAEAFAIRNGWAHVSA